MMPLLAPTIEAPAEGAIPDASDKEEIIDFLKDDSGEEKEDEVLDLPKDKGKADKDEEQKEGEEQEEVDELEALEEDLEEPDEEKLELDTPVPRREILKKYPKLFEDFPYLEKAYYRDQQFTRMFETPAAAKEVFEKAEVLDKFDNDLRDGNITNMLKAAQNEGSLYKISDGYLKALADVDEKAYTNVLTQVIRTMTNNMLEHSKEDGQEVLKHAATIVNQFVFGSTKFENPGRLHKEEKKDEKESAITEKEQKFVERQMQTAVTDLNGKVNKVVRNTIKAHIDPKNSMSDYVRNSASRDVYDTLVDLIDKDRDFKSLVNRLWDRVKKDDFSDTSIKRIYDAYNSKARTLLPSVIKKARAEALRSGNNTKKVKDDEEDDDVRESASPKNRRPRKESSPSADKYRGKSTLQALMEDD